MTITRVIKQELPAGVTPAQEAAYLAQLTDPTRGRAKSAWIVEEFGKRWVYALYEFEDPAAPLGARAGQPPQPPGTPILAPAGPAVAAGSDALAGIRAAGLQPPRRADDATVEKELERYFAVCIIPAQHRAAVDRACDQILASQPRYPMLAKGLGIPWWMIGCLHNMESSCDFTTHLHNGDLLARPTVKEPPGRPRPTGSNFSWEESAEDALRGHKLDRVTNWSIARALRIAERYNGLGYRSMGLPSPYLWGLSNLFVKGKFVRDREFDPEASTAQAGVGTVLRRLIERGIPIP